MKSFPILIGGVLVFGGLLSAEASSIAPDSLILKDGRTVDGLIVKNTFNAVWLQEKNEEVRYPKSEIVRILDRADDDAAHTAVLKTGELPPWRTIVNDLRSNDAIKSLVEVPAIMIDNGVFKNVPYKSFRVNEMVELNVYGDPEKPVAVEIGIFGSKVRDDKLRKAIRAYLAGFLTTRDEISKLYALDFSGGEATSGKMTLEITPPDAPDAFGGWWMSLYRVNDLNKVRLSDKEYAELVRPVDEVMDKDGNIFSEAWQTLSGNVPRVRSTDPNAPPVALRGFYRDSNGTFRLIEE